MYRRDMLKLGLVLSGALLVSPSSAQAAPPPWPTGGQFDELSPAIVCPFEDELKDTFFKTALPGKTPDLARDRLADPENGGFLPNGTVYPQVTGDDALTTYRNSLERIVALQQRNSGNNKQFPPQVFYVLKVKEARHLFHNKPPYAAGSVIWGYDGKYPGPTFRSNLGEPILVRIVNELIFDENGNPRPPEIFGGFGRPRISTHLHNGHTASESDGNPADFYPPSYDEGETLHVPKYPPSIKGLRFRDHHYAMFRAGLDPQRGASEAAPNVNDGDVAESISTLWYHDHSLHFTAENTYKGLVGVHLVFDEIDSGNENDSNPKALNLPSGKFDIPLLFQDKQFRLVKNDAGDEVAELFLPLKNAGSPITSGFLGDVIAVNGQLKPKLEVKRRKHRFRLVNAGPSRFYQFFLTKRRDLIASPPEDQGFIQIGNDESLLEKPYAVPATDGLLLAVSERADIVIDFTDYANGDKLYLVNRLIMKHTGIGPEFDRPFKRYKTVPVNGADDRGDYILRFDVVGDPVPNQSRVPPQLRKSPVLPTVAFPMGNPEIPRTEPDVSVAATMGQTLVFRQADAFGTDHGIKFTDESRVLLKGEDPATKPGFVLKQTDDLGLYGKVVPPGPNGPTEIARFEVIEKIGDPLIFRSVVHDGKGRVEGAGGGPRQDLPQITIDAGAGPKEPGLKWACGIQDLTPGQLRMLGNRHRVFEFAQAGKEDGRDWTINGRPFHASPAGSATIGIGRLDVPRNSLLPGSDDGPDGEVWTIRNTGAWAHPVHIHLEEFQILWRRIIVEPAIITIEAGPNVAWRSGEEASTPAKPLKLAAKKGQTLVFRHADQLLPHGIVFTTPDLVLLKTDAQGSKPNAVLKQTDNLGLYNKDVAGAPNPQELARFEVIQDISTAPAFQCTVHTTDMMGEVSEDKCGNDVVISGTRPPEYELCKKDVLRLDPNEEVQIFLRFRDFLGKYPIHCHNVLHEDHEMMLRFDVVGDQ